MVKKENPTLTQHCKPAILQLEEINIKAELSAVFVVHDGGGCMALFDVRMFFTVVKKIETNAIHLPGFWSPNSSWRGRVTYTYQVFLISPSTMKSESHVWRSSNISLSKSLHIHYSTTVSEVVIIISILKLRNLNFKWKSQREYSNRFDQSQHPSFYLLCNLKIPYSEAKWWCGLAKKQTGSFTWLLSFRIW